MENAYKKFYDAEQARIQAELEKKAPENVAEVPRIGEEVLEETPAKGFGKKKG